MSKIEVDDLRDPSDIPELEIEVPDVQLATLAGDVRDAVLGIFKTHRKPWNDMTQTDQNMLVEGVAKFSREFVEEIVQAVTGWEYPRAVGKLETFKSTDSGKGQIECKLVFQRIPENLETLGMAVGDQVAVLMFSSDSLKGERAPATTIPDQPGLPFNAGSQKAGDALAPDLGQGDLTPDVKSGTQEDPVDAAALAAAKLAMAHADAGPAISDDKYRDYLIETALGYGEFDRAVMEAAVDRLIDTQEIDPAALGDGGAQEEASTAPREEATNALRDALVSLGHAEGAVVDWEVMREPVLGEASQNGFDRAELEEALDWILGGDAAGPMTAALALGPQDQGDVEGPSEIEAEAADFEASAEELAQQVHRDKLVAEREGGTTEPKARKSRATAKA